MKTWLPSSRRQPQRKGAAVAELAVCLPVIILVVFGTIETCSMIFLKQSLRICAYEGARVALVPGSNAGNVLGGCQSFLDGRNIQSATVTVTPSDFDSQPYGTLVTVSVSANCSANSVLPPWFYAGQQLRGEVHMMIER